MPLAACCGGDRRDQAGSPSWSIVRALVAHSRQVRVAGVGRTERIRFDPGTVRSPAVQASLGFDCPRELPRPTIARQLASPARGPVVFRMRHCVQAFSSLCSVRAEGRGREDPHAVNQPGTRPPRRWAQRPWNSGSPLSTMAGENAFVDGCEAPFSVGPRAIRRACAIR